jgi:hypothetical protein
MLHDLAPNPGHQAKTVKIERYLEFSDATCTRN